jgi:hypothetical protein
MPRLGVGGEDGRIEGQEERGKEQVKKIESERERKQREERAKKK